MIQTLIQLATYLTTMVATLRAGSRVLYLHQHNGTLGVMDGPLIQFKCTNDTSVNLFDISQGFSLAIKVGLMHSPIRERAKNNSESCVKGIYQVQADMRNSTFSWVRDIIQSVRNVTNVLSHTSRDAFLESSWQRATGFLSKKSALIDSDNIDLSRDRFGRKLDFLAERKVSFTMSSPMPDSREKKRVATNITSYASEVFSDLRYRFGIDENEFRQALANGGPFVSFQSNSKGAARAGGIFFFSRSGSYMIKSIKKAEGETLLAFLHEYYEHMRRCNRRSLLTRFCGMYRIQMKDITANGNRNIMNRLISRKENSEEDYILIVMNSVYPAESSSFISERFDLKGSTVGRECSQDEILKKGSDAVLKDLDLAKEVHIMRTVTNQNCAPSYGLNIGARRKSSFMSQLQKDVKFLVKCGVMDYSLLVGVVDMDQNASSDIIPTHPSLILNKNLSDEDQPRVSKKELSRIVSFLCFPLQTLVAPPYFVFKNVARFFENVISSVLTLPLPYYGAGVCGVDGGSLSTIHGNRRGHRCVYYFGLIDFLQPWTMKKVIEKELKGVIGYDVTAISCVDPKAYGSRFLGFMNAHIT